MTHTVPAVDRRHAVIGVELELRGHRRQPLRGVRVEEVRVERAREERVVDAEQRVGLGMVLHLDRRADELPGVTGANTFTLNPVAAVNAASTDFDTAKLS